MSRRLLHCAIALGFALALGMTARHVAYGAAFGFSDHVAHMNAARVFPRVGWRIWTTPIAQLLPPVSDAALSAIPDDVRSQGTLRFVPGWPVSKPFTGGWIQLPRPYPPGDMLLVAPVALLYHLTSLSYAAACHLLLALFLTCAAVSYLPIARHAPSSRSGLYVALALATYAYVLLWASRGFYDAVALLPLALAGFARDARRWTSVAVLLAVASFFHFRALFFLPWAVEAIAHLVTERAWRQWTFREYGAIAIAALLALAALTALVLVAPWLGRFPLENPIHPGHLKWLPCAAMLAVTAVCLAVFGATRSRGDAVLLLWMLLVVVSTRQVQMWHAFLMFPWLFVAARRERIRAARALFVGVMLVAVFL